MGLLQDTLCLHTVQETLCQLSITTYVDVLTSDQGSHPLHCLLLCAANLYVDVSSCCSFGLGAAVSMPENNSFCRSETDHLFLLLPEGVRLRP